MKPHSLPLWTRALLLAFGLSGLTLLGGGAATFPSSPDVGLLALWEMNLVGLRMQLPADKLQLPGGATLPVHPRFLLGDRDATTEEVQGAFPADARLTGTLTSPDSGSVRLEGTLLGGLLLPPLRTQGTYVLSGVRLEQGGKVLLEAPSTISIECLGEVLISSVTATPMTLQELKAAGLQLGAANYEGRRFTMALTIGSRKVDLSVPVAIPIYNGVEDPRAGGEISRLEIGNIEGGAPDLDLNVALADLKPDRDPFTLSRPAVSHMLNHNFKALIVVPGSIGYLHQFYKVDLVVFNTLAAASPFVVSHLKATYAPPPAADGVGPLRLAARAGDGIDDAAMKPIRAADGDGRPGEGPDRLRGGESGTATYYLEALKTGSHPLDFLIQGQFEGGDLSEPIPLSGKAEGRVLVVNPTFNLMLVHPDVVRKGETYVMEARLTNTSGTLANGVTLSIDRTRLGNVKLVETAECPAVQQAPDTLAPGQTVTFRFQFRAQKTGEVTGSYLYAEEGTIGFQLSAGVTERNVRLNPDTLTLPRTLEGLPQALREAMLKVLGQAYCVATSKATLPAGVLPVGRDVVTGRMARSLSEQGLFLGMGTDRLRIWWDLWKLFTLNPDSGFDQLMRTTQAGAELRDAFLEAWTSWLGGFGPADRLRELAAFGEGTGGTALVGIQGAGPGLVIGLADDSSRFLQCAGQDHDLPAQGAALGTSASGSILVQSPVPAGASLHTVLTNEGSAAMTLKLGIVRPVAGQGDPECSTLSLTLGQGVTATLAPGASGMLEACLASRAGASLGRVPAEASGPVPAEPFRVLSVHRYDLDLFPDATPYGTHLMVLFNRPTMPLELPSDEAGFQAAEALVQVEANHAWRKATGYQTDSAGGTVLDEDGNPKKLPSPPALVQAFPRVAALYLEKPVGPYVPRRLTLSEAWKDAAGRALEGERTWPIQSGLVPGGALVRGRVRRLDGTGLPAKLTYWYYSALMDASQQDLETSQLFAQEEVWNFYALVTSNVATEADGSFQLDFVPEPVSYALGPFLLQADLPEGRAFAQASVVGNGQTVQMDLVLEGKGAVEGYVLDAQGGPVSGARVQAVQEQATCGLNRGTGGGALAVTATTDTGGHYRLDGLKTGVFSLRALKGLFGVAASGELARDGQVVRQDLVLKGRTGRVRAQVQDEQGHPMPDQIIRLGFPAGLNRNGSGPVGYVYPEEARPGPDGWARFQDVPAGDIRLVAPYLPPSLVTDFAGYLDPDAEVAAVLRLSPKGELATARIQVADASGRPVPGAYLSWSGSLQGSFFARTGEDGRTDPFRLRPGLPVTAYAYHPGWVGMVQGDSLTPQAGGSYLLRVVMPARAVIQGTVRRPDGSPVPGAYVAIPPVWDDNNRNRLAITDARGAYRLADVPVGTAFRLAAVGPELRTCHNDQVQVSPDQLLTLDIPLPYPGNNTLQGTVYQPQEGSQRISAIAQVWVTGQLPDITPGRDGGNGHWGLLSGTETGAVQSLPVTGEDVQNGRPGFRITGLPSGPFRLAASSGLFPIEVNAGGDFGTAVGATLTQDLTLVSSFAGELKGRVVLPDGQTPAARGARVSLTGGSIGDLTVFVQDDGLYKFAKVIPEGRYVLRAEDPATGFFCSLPLAMQREASQVRNLRLWGKGTLRIQALDSQGQPLSLGDVSLAHSRQSAPLEPGDLPRLVQSLRGATDGRLVFEDLLEGQVSVKLRNQTGLTGLASAEIPVGGGDAEVTVRLQPVGGIRGPAAPGRRYAGPRRTRGRLRPAGRPARCLAGRRSHLPGRCPGAVPVLPPARRDPPAGSLGSGQPADRHGHRAGPALCRGGSLDPRHHLLPRQGAGDAPGGGRDPPVRAARRPLRGLPGRPRPGLHHRGHHRPGRPGLLHPAPGRLCGHRHGSRDPRHRDPGLHPGPQPGGHRQDPGPQGRALPLRHRPAAPRRAGSLPGGLAAPRRVPGALHDPGRQRPGHPRGPPRRDLEPRAHGPGGPLPGPHHRQAGPGRELRPAGRHDRPRPRERDRARPGCGRESPHGPGRCPLLGLLVRHRAPDGPGRPRPVRSRAAGLLDRPRGRRLRPLHPRIRGPDRRRGPDHGPHGGPPRPSDRSLRQSGPLHFHRRDGRGLRSRTGRHGRRRPVRARRPSRGEDPEPSRDDGPGPHRLVGSLHPGAEPPGPGGGCDPPGDRQPPGDPRGSPAAPAAPHADPRHRLRCRGRSHYRRLRRLPGRLPARGPAPAVPGDLGRRPHRRPRRILDHSRGGPGRAAGPAASPLRGREGLDPGRGGPQDPHDRPPPGRPRERTRPGRDHGRYLRSGSPHLLLPLPEGRRALSARRLPGDDLHRHRHPGLHPRGGPGRPGGRAPPALAPHRASCPALSGRLGRAGPGALCTHRHGHPERPVAGRPGL